MKVKYVGRKDTFAFDRKKEYEVISVERGWYRIMTELEEDYLFPSDQFEVILMKGLRTQESNKFIKFFSLVQDKALESNSVFFLDSGDGNDFETDEMEGENLSGWLIPFARVEEFEKIWKKKAEDDEWVDFFCFAEWEKQSDSIKIVFSKE